MTGTADRRVIQQVFMTSDPMMNLAGTVPLRKTESDGRVRAIVYLYPGE